MRTFFSKVCSKTFAVFLSALFLWLPLSPSFAGIPSHCGMEHHIAMTATSLKGVPEIPTTKMSMSNRHCSHKRGSCNCMEGKCSHKDGTSISSCGSMFDGQDVALSGFNVIPASFVFVRPSTLYNNTTIDAENNPSSFIGSPYRPPIS